MLKLKIYLFNMPREIKFRAWDKESKLFENPINDYHTFQWYQKDRFVLMQFTGLHDKNGKEIYEGDLIKVLDRDWPSQLTEFPEMNHQQYLDHISSICEVRYVKDGFRLIQLKGRGYYYDNVGRENGRDVFEIIGNIYENPELLK